jgi:hypothetical protein
MVHAKSDRFVPTKKRRAVTLSARCEWLSFFQLTAAVGGFFDWPSDTGFGGLVLFAFSAANPGQRVRRVEGGTVGPRFRSHLPDFRVKSTRRLLANLMTSIRGSARLRSSACQIRVVLNRIRHFGSGQVVLFAVCLGLGGLGDSLLDQEALYAGNAMLREGLVEGIGAAHVNMTFQNEVSVRPGLKIRF